jgi:hypothetical protein
MLSLQGATAKDRYYSDSVGKEQWNFTMKSIVKKMLSVRVT